jgi:hypothetical protein
MDLTGEKANYLKNYIEHINNDGLYDIIEANSDAINRYYFNQKKFDPRKN